MIGGCIHKFVDWPLGARTANVTALCLEVHLCRYFVSQSSGFCCHNPCVLLLKWSLSLLISLSTQSGSLWISLVLHHLIGKC